MKRGIQFLLVLTIFSIVIYLVISAGKYNLSYSKNDIVQTYHNKNSNQKNNLKTNKQGKLYSERKKRVKGFAKKDSPNLYAEWYAGIRTRDGQKNPAYKMNYKV